MKFAFYKGRGTLIDRLIRWWQRGPYSHVEAVLADNADGTFECASAMRGTGIRIASIALPATDWNFVEAPGDVDVVRAWFAARAGAGYDWLGVFGFVLRPVGQEAGRYFCSEAIAAALGVSEPWRFDPNGLADLLVDVEQAGAAATG